ncbi:MAG: ribosomal protein S18-alanine N-acetyltransferase [Dehalococcoidia bacterium]
MHTTAVRYLVRPMNLGDIPQVMEIERESFPAIWPQTAFKRELQQNRLARYLVAVEAQDQPPSEAEAPPAAGPEPSGLVRFLADVRHVFAGEEEPPLPPPEARPLLIVGFVGVWIMADEAHIVTIAVRESHRGRGIGELLLIAAIEVAHHNQRSVISLECRASNTVALKLYEKYSFKQVGIRPRYYSDNQEDACLLARDRVQSPAFQDLFQRLKREHSQRWGECRLQL